MLRARKGKFSRPYLNIIIIDTSTFALKRENRGHTRHQQVHAVQSALVFGVCPGMVRQSLELFDA